MSMVKCHYHAAFAALLVSSALSSAALAQPSAGITAITNTTVIDGTGGQPQSGVTVLITGNKITDIGKSVRVPPDAKVIDGKGKFVTPGLIDTNVHIDMNVEMFPLLVYSGVDAYLENTISTEAAQMALRYGFTTIVDTWGPLQPLTTLRDRINAWEIEGPRLMVAGPIMGYDGFYSPSERFMPTPWPWMRHHDKWFAQGVGPELTLMYPDEVQAAVSRYLDLEYHPDVIKLGVSAHGAGSPIPISFSPDVLKAIVATAHSKGRKVQAHATTVESFRMAVESGIDLITHAEVTNGPIRPELAKHVCKSSSYFAIFAHRTLPNYALARELTPKSHRGVETMMELLDEPPSKELEAAVQAITPDRDRTERMPKYLTSSVPTNPTRANQKMLIGAGCKIAFGTDSWPPMYEDVAGYNRWAADMGNGGIDALEGFVTTLGMTPAQALVVATRNSADAMGLLSQVGTVEKGKLADLLILDADPLQNISNIRKLSTVIRDGHIVDPKTLPTKPKFYKR